MICSYCKSEIPDSSKFCNQCGCKIVSIHQGKRCDLRPYIEDGKFGAKDKLSGKIVISPKYYSLRSFHDGLSKVWGPDFSGFINEDGVEIIPVPSTTDVQDFINGFAIIHGGKGNRNKVGYIDTIGNNITPCIFDDAQPFHEGCAVVYKDDLAGVIDNDGKFLIDCTFDTINNVSEQVITAKKDGMWQHLDLNGRLLFGIQYDYADSFYNGYSYVRKNGRNLLINHYGEELSIPGWEVETALGNNQFIAANNGKKAVVDINGKILSTGLYDRISYLDNQHIIESGHFDTDILITEKNSLLGYISSSGQDIIDCKFGFVDFFQDGYSWCSDGKKNALLNTKGELISPFIYDYVRYCGDNIFLINQNGFWTYINPKGELVFKQWYKKAEGFKSGTAEVQLMDGKDGLIDIWGNFKYR